MKQSKTTGLGGIQTAIAKKHREKEKERSDCIYYRINTGFFESEHVEIKKEIVRVVNHKGVVIDRWIR